MDELDNEHFFELYCQQWTTVSYLQNDSFDKKDNLDEVLTATNRHVDVKINKKKKCRVVVMRNNRKQK